MKITNAEKFLLALMITGCLTTGALAADRIIVDSGDTYKDEISGSETITDTFENLPSGESVSSGGAIYNSGTITTISGCTFTGNSSSGAQTLLAEQFIMLARLGR